MYTVVDDDIFLRAIGMWKMHKYSYSIVAWNMTKQHIRIKRAKKENVYITVWYKLK